MRRLSSAVVAAVLIALCSGCYHHHLRAGSDRLNSSYFRQTLGASGGKRGEFIIPPPRNGAAAGAALPPSADCKDNGVFEVGVTSYWKYAAGTVFSLGRWSRVKTEWLCAKEPPVIGPRGLPPGSPPQTPAAGPTASRAGQPRQPNAGRADFTKTTVHAFFWGALQQNLLRPSAAAKTPANCKSLQQVKLPVNYGYALITVFTAGIWSPMKVAWQCGPDPIVAATFLPPATTSPGVTLPGFSLPTPVGPSGSNATHYVFFPKQESHVRR